MRGKVFLNLAVSLDGYIAEEDGGYGWIAGQGDSSLDTAREHVFADFLKTIDVVVMGNKSFAQGEHSYLSDYADKKVYVATHAPREDRGNVTFVGEAIVDVILKERDAGKNVYLFGGGISIDPFIKADAIDEYTVAIVPILLGRGIPLFLGGSPAIPLKLKDYSVRDGIVALQYTRR